MASLISFELVLLFFSVLPCTCTSTTTYYYMSSTLELAVDLTISKTYSSINLPSHSKFTASSCKFQCTIEDLYFFNIIELRVLQENRIHLTIRTSSQVLYSTGNSSCSTVFFLFVLLQVLVRVVPIPYLINILGLHLINNLFKHKIPEY
jgi:hypothetical protein